jgi:Sec-independent protein translocase protein TatA
MFDIAFSELVLVLIVAAAIFSPKDIFIVAKNSSYYIKKLKGLWEDYWHYLSEEMELYSQKDVIRYIEDKDGIMREAYDLSSIQPNIIVNTEKEK